MYPQFPFTGYRGNLATGISGLSDFFARGRTSGLSFQRGIRSGKVGWRKPPGEFLNKEEQEEFPHTGT